MIRHNRRRLERERSFRVRWYRYTPLPFITKGHVVRRNGGPVGDMRLIGYQREENKGAIGDRCEGPSISVGLSCHPPAETWEIKVGELWKEQRTTYFQDPGFGYYPTDEERWCFIRTTREGISGSGRQSWSVSRGISTRGGGLVLGSVGVAIQGASYDPANVNPRWLLGGSK